VDELLDQGLAFEVVGQVKSITAGFVRIDSDMGWMIELVLDHLLVVLGVAALDVPAPDHALLIKHLVGHE